MESSNEDQDFSKLEGSIEQFWTGNPQNDIQTGHALLRSLDTEQSLGEINSPYLCCPAVPTHVHIIEFCQFIEAFQKQINKVRVFKSPQPNQYMIAIKLLSSSDAKEFAKYFQRRRFNQIEPEFCLVFQLVAARISLQKNSSSSSSSSLEGDGESPGNVMIDTSSVVNPFQQNHIRDTDEIMKRLRTPEVLFDQGGEDLSQNNCPICLESLNDISSIPASGITSPRGTENKPLLNKMKSEKMRVGEGNYSLTILCCHTFHHMCLMKCDDTICPLCRYPQSPTESSTCDECGAAENVWLCLVCGFVGCFNVQAFQNNQQQQNFIELQGHGHSLSHFQETKHTYAKEVYSQYVWDFCKQNYVHRLIQNQVDGKLVEFGDPVESSESITPENPVDNTINTSSSLPPQVKDPTDDHFTIDSVHRYNKKLESLNYEYNRMLASTLDNQRAFFEHRLAGLNQEESLVIAAKKQEIRDIETNQLAVIDEQITRELAALDESKEVQIELDDKYRAVMTERLKCEQEKARIKAANDKYSNMVQMEILALKKQLEDCDQVIMEVKQERQDLQEHIKMSIKVKKSKNIKEIQEGQTLMFESKKPAKRK